MNLYIIKPFLLFYLKNKAKKIFFMINIKTYLFYFLKDYEAFQNLTPDFLEKQYEVLSKKI